MGPYGTNLGDLNAQTPNGTWQLFVRDGTGMTPGLSVGFITSWSLQVTTSTGELQLTPASKDFGGLAPGQTSAAQSFSVMNVGNAPITLNAPQLQGAHADQFSLGANTCGGQMMPDENCSFQATFGPTSIGEKAATVVLDGTGIAGSPRASRCREPGSGRCSRRRRAASTSAR